MVDVSVLNDAAADVEALEEGGALHKALLHCCGARKWVAELAKRLPMRDFADLLRASDAADQTLGREDWLEAFDAHPRIGRAKKPIGEWEAQEQQATKNADEAVLDRLEDLNAQYFDKFGYIYIVCATGKSASEMLAILESRLGNAPEEELAVAAREQSKITKIRLEKLLTELHAARSKL